jgi:predicted nucleotidyltransferase
VLTVSGVAIDEARLAAICDRYGIAKLSIFGSRVRGTARPDSDIDMLYTLRPGHRLGWDIEQLADELAELFGHPVDLVAMRALHPLLRRSVLAETQPLYAA